MNEWAVIGIYVLAVGTIGGYVWKQRQQGRTFHLLFSGLYLLTFFGGFPFSSVLSHLFETAGLPPTTQCFALLTAWLGYGLYAVGYHGSAYGIARFTTWGDAPLQAVVPAEKIATSRARLTACLLAGLAVGCLAWFVGLNGWLLFRLEKYSQIFSPLVSGVPLKRFFYFFLPALLIGYFLSPNRTRWWGLLWLGTLFGGLSYLAVGGTRANLALAVAFFLLIGIYHRYLGWKWWLLAGLAMVGAMFGLALARYGLAVTGREAWFTFLYLSRDTFSPWENWGRILASEIAFQGLMPIVRDFYVYIPQAWWADRPDIVWNTANYFTKVVLGNQSGLAMSPTLLGSFFIMGGLPLLAAGCVTVGVLVQGGERLLAWARARHSALWQAYCFGNLFNIIVLVREGADAFVSRWLFFSVVFGLGVGVASLWLSIKGRKTNG